MDPYRNCDRRPVKKLNRRLARWFRFWNRMLGPTLGITTFALLGFWVIAMFHSCISDHQRDQEAMIVAKQEDVDKRMRDVDNKERELERRIYVFEDVARFSCGLPKDAVSEMLKRAGVKQ